MDVEDSNRSQETNSRAFRITVGIMGAILLLLIIGALIFATAIFPRNRARSLTQVALVNDRNTEAAQFSTRAAEIAASEAQINSTRTAYALEQTSLAEASTQTATMEPPTASATITRSPTPIFGPTNTPADGPTEDPRTATAEALVNITTHTPTPKLPDAGGGGPTFEDLLEFEVEDLSQGRLLFNPPVEMIAGEVYRVEARVIRLSEFDDVIVVEATLEANLQGLGEPQIDPMPVGTFMKARLTGDRFNITPLNEEEQLVLGKSYTQWAWDVVPRSSGEHKLNLTMTARIRTGSREGVRDHPVITKTVFVRVNPTYSVKVFVGKYWQWLAGTIILPSAGWAWRVYSKRKAKDEEEKEKEKVRFE